MLPFLRASWHIWPMPSNAAPAVLRAVDITPTKPGLWAPRSAPIGHDPSNGAGHSCWRFDGSPPLPGLTDWGNG